MVQKRVSPKTSNLEARKPASRKTSQMSRFEYHAEQLLFMLLQIMKTLNCSVNARAACYANKSDSSDWRFVLNGTAKGEPFEKE
jgi:hypothetical protein